jgi:hypothetical protein
MAEGARQERLPHADGSEDDDVPCILDEAQAAQLLEDALVEVHLGRLVPALHDHVGVEPGHLGAVPRGRALAPLDLIDEQEEQQFVEGRAVLLGEADALRERGEDPAEAQALQPFRDRDEPRNEEVAGQMPWPPPLPRRMGYLLAGDGAALGAAGASVFAPFTVPFFSTFFSDFFGLAFFSSAEATLLCVCALA